MSVKHLNVFMNHPLDIPFRLQTIELEIVLCRSNDVLMYT